jgi:microcystin-dependent protein
MSQADWEIPSNQSGLDYRTQDNAGKEAIVTSHKGSSAPSYVEAGMFWLDDSADPVWTYKFYDGTDHITIGTLNKTTNVWTPAGAAGADGSTTYGVDTGSNDTYAITLSSITAYTDGMRVWLNPNTSNTGACTLNISGLGAKNIKVGPNRRDPLDAELKADFVHSLIYDLGSDCFVLQNPARTRVGEIIMYAGSTAPKGALACDGSAISRTDYADLFTQAGTEFGVGNGSTTFNIPDFRGRSPLGQGTGTGLTARTAGTNYGEESHTPTISETASHDHTLLTGIGGGGTTRANRDAFDNQSSSTAPIQNSGSGTAFNVIHPTLGTRFAIIYQ